MILRPAVVYGPGNQANILSLIEAVSRGRFFLIGKNDNIKSMISLRNLAAALNHLLPLSFFGTQLFYLTDKDSFSVAQIVGMIAEILNKGKIRALPVPLAQSAALFGDIYGRIFRRNFPLTSSRLKALLEETNFSSARLQATGFIHPQTTREGLEEMIAWYLCSTRRSSIVNW